MRDFRIGAVMPSSRFAVRHIMRTLPDRLRTIIEYGPGDGALTNRLLERLDAHGRLLAIEANPHFVATLASMHDPRFTLVHGDATLAQEYAREHGLPDADLVISGIPFSMLGHKTRTAVVEMTWNMLRPGGIFLVYQTSPLMLPYLKRKFSVQMSFEPLNVPPYFVMKATKGVEV